MTFLAIFLTLIVIGGIYGFWYLVKRKSPNIGVEAMLNSKKTPQPALKRSKYFPDELFEGALLTLDSTLKHLVAGTMIGFPESHLSVKGFRYFTVDGNEFEEVIFNKCGNRDYIVMYDSANNQIFFLNRVTSVGIGANEEPPMVSQETLDLDEGGKKYFYTDVTGLMEVRVTDDTSKSFNRLIRVYERELTETDQEFVVSIIEGNNPSVVHYYIGLIISIHQLEQF